MDPATVSIEKKVLEALEGKFVSITSKERRAGLIANAARAVAPNIGEAQLKEITEDINNFEPVEKYLQDETIEDIMINNTKNIFIYSTKRKFEKIEENFADLEELLLFVSKLRLYATNESANGNVIDIHMPMGSRANIVTSPRGPDITIRNFKKQPYSIIDLINMGELDYQIAARLWVYVDGFGVRPANMLIGGMPASGKTTLLNAMFSFFRPSTRVVTIEETYELDTSTQENCVNLETSEDLSMQDLIKNAMRMRPDMIIIGEVRGAEANDMITAMNIGKICMSTIHAGVARDIINRLQNIPMSVPMEMIPVIDAIMVVGSVMKDGKNTRKIVQMSEVSGVETQVLLSDLYKFDYKTFESMPILPSVAYRDTISKVLGIVPQDLLAEERVRAAVLAAMNKKGIHDLKEINEVVRGYYESPESTLDGLGLKGFEPVIRR